MPTFWKCDLLLGKHFDFVSYNINAPETIIQLIRGKLGENTEQIFSAATAAEVLLVLLLFVSAPPAVSAQLLWNHTLSQTFQLIQTPTILGFGILKNII